MTAPFQFCGTTAASGISSKTLTVTTATAAGDALTVAVSLGGASTPTVSSVTDSAGNTYALAKSYTTSTPYLFVYTATGSTAALTTSSTVTVTLNGSPTAGWAILGTDCPGVSTIDVSAVANGNSAAPSVSGTPSQSGETALAIYTWNNAGGAGTVSSPFTQVAQEAPASNAYLTGAYDLSPTSGASLTAAASITSAVWRAVLLTFGAGSGGTPVSGSDTGSGADAASVRVTGSDTGTGTDTATTASGSGSSISVLSFTAANALTVTIPATTAGNTLLVLVSSEPGTSGTITGVTLGGAADHFAQTLPPILGTTTDGDTGQCFAWWDRNCAGGQTSVVVSGTDLGIASNFGGVFVLEIAGLGTAPAIDQQGSAGCPGAGSATWGATAAGATTAAAEFWFGVANTYNAATAIPGSPWTTKTGGSYASAGYQVTSSTGTPSYSGTASGADAWAAMVGSIIPGTGTGNVSVAGSDTGTGTDTAAAGVTSLDAGTGTDTGKVSVAGPDAGTVTDTAKVAVADSDAGTGADTGTTSAAVPGSDTGSGSETARTGVAGSDTGTGTDSGQVTQGATSADTAGGTDTGTVTVSQAGPDAGTGTDTGSVRVTGADTGAGTDTATVGVTGSDTGTGTETSASGPTGPDTGTGTDTGIVQVAGSDIGAGADTGSVTQGATSADTGTGADAGTVTASQTGPDTGSGADTASVKVTDADTGAGSDMEGTSSTRASADTGSESETAGVAVPAPDTGSASDAASVAVTAPDTGSGAEAAAVGVAAADTAAGADAASVAAALSSPDTVAGTETSAVAAALSSPDTVAGTDAASVKVTGADTGAGSDAAAVQVIASDTGAGADAAAVAVPAADTGAGAEAASVRVIASDTGSGAEAGSFVAVAMPAAVVQHQPANTGSSTASTLTITLPNPTAAGNTLVVCVSHFSRSVSGITLGGSAGNFTSRMAVNNTGLGYTEYVDIWEDAGCAGGQTSVVITMSGTAYIAADVYEVSELIPTGAFDQQASNDGVSATPGTGSATPSQAAGIAFAIVMANAAITGSPGTPWVSAAEQTYHGTICGHQAGYDIFSTAAPVSYTAAIGSGSNGWTAALATFRAIPPPVYVSSSDTAAAADAGTAAVHVAGSDTGTGADSASAGLAIYGADTGAGADTGSVTRVLVSGSDTASGADTSSTRASIAGADTGAGTESTRIIRGRNTAWNAPDKLSRKGG